MRPLTTLYNHTIAAVGGAVGTAVKEGIDRGLLHFPYVSEALAKVPFALGWKLRHAVYARCMDHLGSSTVIHQGVVFDAAGQSIGEDVWISEGCHIGLAEIGDHVLIGPRVVLLAVGSHRFDRTDVPIKQQGNVERRPVRIGSGAWIGAHATVMADVGHDAIVSAGAVVLSPVPPYAIVGGNPARVLRQRTGVDDPAAY